MRYTDRDRILTEFHPTKNPTDLLKNNLAKYSKKLVWWQCSCCPDHEWQATPSNRFNNGAGCPFCSGKKVHLTNCLAVLRPDLSIEWHPNKNGNLTPFNVTSGSKKKVWWKCPFGDDHEWLAAVCDRSRRGCPVCAGKKVAYSTCLGVLRPDLAEQWHPFKNADLTPFDVTTGSNKKVWWKCRLGDDHEWLMTVWDRNTGKSCPICSGHRVSMSTSLGSLRPDLAKQWHPSKNGDLTPFDITVGSSKKVWWKCHLGDDHEWETTVAKRNVGGGCPVCSGQLVAHSTCLATLHPDLSIEWHPTKNGSLTANNVTASSSKKVWWQCSNSHEWKSIISNRTMQRSRCPYCSKVYKGEVAIETYLKAKRINYVRQHSYPDCFYKKLLKFDFLVYPENKIPAIIEFNGDQHDRPIEWFGGKSSFLDTQKRDQIKLEYCRSRNIPLLIIPYKCINNISQILEHFIGGLPLN